MNNDRLFRAISALCGLVSKLRDPLGCPWDHMQTDDTIKMYLIEEAYEVLDAIENGSPEDVCQELGDLLFQIIFLADLAKDRGEFGLEEVIEKITEKMIRRHPHVFGSEKVNGPSEVSDNWEQIKKEEKGVSERPPSRLQEVPVSLPALLRAHRLSERASKMGFDWEGREEIWDKVKEEFEELAAALKERNKERVGEEIGDLIFSLVNLARHWGLNGENVLRNSNQKFIKRFKMMGEKLKAEGSELSGSSLQEMDRAWEEIKKR